MLSVVAIGKLTSQPTAKVSKNGAEYMTCTLRVITGGSVKVPAEQATATIRLLAFYQAKRFALEHLVINDYVVVTGLLQVRRRSTDDGFEYQELTLVADTLRHLSKMLFSPPNLDAEAEREPLDHFERKYVRDRFYPSSPPTSD